YLQTITVYVDSKDRSLAGTALRQRLALSEQRILALKRDIEALLTARAAGPAASSAAPDAPTGAAEAAAYVGFEDRVRGATSDISGRVKAYVPILSAASDVVDIGCG